MRSLFYCFALVVTPPALESSVRAAAVKDECPAPLKVDTSALAAWQRDVWAHIDIYGRYVSEAELELNPLFQHLGPKHEPKSKQVSDRSWIPHEEIYGPPGYPGHWHACGDVVTAGDVPVERGPSIYLLMLCRGRPGANGRMLEAHAAVRIDGAGYCRFTIAPPGFFPRRDPVYLLVLVAAGSDHQLPDAKVQDILRSRPEIAIERCFIK